MCADARSGTIRKRFRHEVSAADGQLDVALVGRNRLEPFQEEFEAVRRRQHALHLVLFDSLQSVLQRIARQEERTAPPERINQELESERRDDRHVAVDTLTICEAVAEYCQMAGGAPRPEVIAESVAPWDAHGFRTGVDAAHRVDPGGVFVPPSSIFLPPPRRSICPD